MRVIMTETKRKFTRMNVQNNIKTEKNTYMKNIAENHLLFEGW